MNEKKESQQPEARGVVDDAARLDWIDSQVSQDGDGYTQPYEAGWFLEWQQQKPHDRWRGVRAYIDAEIAKLDPDDLDDLTGDRNG